jgi:hypothetical protein
MIRVRIAGSLIEKMLATGNFPEGRTEVVEGLPPGARLAGITYDAGVAYFFFTEEARSDADYRDVEIVLRSHR